MPNRYNFYRLVPGVAAYVVWPFQRFFKTSATGGILLIVAAAAAMIAANSPWSAEYHHLWENHIGFSAAGFSIDKSLHHWINDGLMAVFFFLVGLEIKREVLAGELSSVSNASLPLAAALGGMVVPAAVYMAVNAGGPGESGWGMSMATDIAFSLGVLAMLGKRVPAALLVFLAALAIVDDIGGILVIALFYSGGINLTPLAGALGLLVVSFAMNRAGVRSTLPYVLVGIVLWFLLLESGIHATVAGVMLAMTIPAYRDLSHGEFVAKIQEQLRFLTGEHDELNYCPVELDHEREQAIIVALEDACHKAEAPLQHIEHHLHPWVTYAIMPLFAFANAGVELSPEAVSTALLEPVSIGVILGLFFGKQLGILSFSWLSVKLGLSRLPGNIGWKHIWGVSILAGIGFTMSLFIGALAFDDPGMLESAKTGILAASLISGVIGFLVLRAVTSKDVEFVPDEGPGDRG